MMIRHCNLRPPLDQYVACLWYSSRSEACSNERLLPSAAADVVIHLERDRFRIYKDDTDKQGEIFSFAVVHGPQSRYFVSDKSQADAVIGVHFLPGGAAPFFGVPIAELVNRHIELEDLWGNRANDLRARLMAVESPVDRIELLEDELLLRLAPSAHNELKVADAVRQFFVAPGTRVSAVAGSSCYSNKHFIHLFKNSVGLSPKLFCRVQRFQTLLHGLADASNVQSARLAVDHGYYDQAHMIRDFREFTGITPLTYSPVTPDSPHHVALG